MISDVLTSGALCKATGLPYRTLDFWCREGLITPSVQAGTGKGGDRLWSAADLLAARYLMALRSGGGTFVQRHGPRVVAFVRRHADVLTEAHCLILRHGLIGMARADALRGATFAGPEVTFVLWAVPPRLSNGEMTDAK